MTATMAQSRAVVAWPAGDTVVLRGRTVRADTRPGRLSRFAAMRWELRPAHPDGHAPACTVNWSRFPTGLVMSFKAFALAAIEYPRPLTPDSGGQQHGQYAAVTTIKTWAGDLSVFADWMRQRRLTRIGEVTERDLADYRTHVLALPRSAIRKRDLLHAVRMLWAYRTHLPAPAQLPGDYPWGAQSSSALAAAAGPGRYNKTPRIATATMEALLAWALRMLEDLGPDIRAAWTEHRQLRAGTHPSQHRHQGLGTADRLHQLGTVAGTVAGRPWREQPIRVDELSALTRHLTTACFTIISYLSGMRPGEVLGLRRGCAASHPTTGELLVHGRRGKGFDRDPLPRTGNDEDADARPWVVVKPVHDAIAMLEALRWSDRLFPASLLRTGNRRTACTDTTRNPTQITADLHAFVAWVNQHFTEAGARAAIPADPTKHLHAARFRRILSAL